MNHRHGPCSPVPSGKKKQQPTFTELLRRDQLRANHIQRQFSDEHYPRTGRLEATVPIALGSPLNTLEYVITVSIGSPAVAQTMFIDTGSDVSWLRCKSRLYDPGTSSTYAPFSCSAPACAQLGRRGTGCSSGSTCVYSVKYGDGSNTTGTYGSDTLTLAGTSEPVISGFQFGCSAVEHGFEEDNTDGLMGLGGDAQSFVSQTAATYGSAFSYCLPPTWNSSGFLTLGAPSSSTSAAFSTTPMLRSKQAATFYGLLLRGISVGGKTLEIPSSVFSAGSIVDSGTVITRLPPTAYGALSAAFRDGMARYQYQPAAPRGLLDTCFDFTGHGEGNNFTVPSVALVLDGGAVVDLHPNGIVQDGCLAFAATDDDGRTGIIGNVQQRTFEVLYDVGQSVFGFRPGAC